MMVTLALSEMAKQDYDSFTFEKIDPDLKVLLPFSSGTTGVPKVRYTISESLWRSS
jgi:acyl-coenzyme A synthetase/AMP-(fatty) acid ligase